jgi:hypothetical protein
MAFAGVAYEDYTWVCRCLNTGITIKLKLLRKMLQIIMERPGWTKI